MLVRIPLHIIFQEGDWHKGWNSHDGEGIGKGILGLTTETGLVSHKE